MTMFSKAYRDFAKLPDVAQVMLALGVAMAIAATALVFQGLMSTEAWLLSIERS